MRHPVFACSAEAEAFSDALQGKGVSGLVVNHVLRRHVFPLFVFTVLFLALYVAYKIVGDPVLKLLKVRSLASVCREKLVQISTGASRLAAVVTYP